MKHIVYILSTACLLVLSTTQAQAVDYTPTRTRPIYQQALTGEMYTTSSSSMPTTVSFLSTSAYSTDKWTESTTPMLNADGSVSAGAYMSGPRKAGPGGTGPGENTVVGPGTPGGDLNKDEQQPLGDAVLPLLLMAAAFCLLRKREII